MPLDQFTALLTGVLLGAVGTTFYLIMYYWLTGRWRRRVDEQMQHIRQSANIDEEKQILRDLSPALSGRERSMIDMGLIFVVAAFIILGQVPQAKDISFPVKTILTISSPLVYAFWLFTIQLSTRLMNDSDMEMSVRIEEERGIYGISRVRREFYGDYHGRGPMMWFRRNHWLLYFILLIIGATMLITTDKDFSGYLSSCKR